MLPLDRNLVFFDLEATGLNIVKDRIVQIALIKLPAGGGEPEELKMNIRPDVPISAEASEVHGLYAEDLRGAPAFGEVAQRLFDFIGEADLAGYNSNRYDVPLLQEEFFRAGLYLDTSGRRLIDAQTIFYRMEPRTLSAALKFYAGEEMTDAHDALADVRATVAVFKGQLAKYAGAEFREEKSQEVTRPFTDMDSVAAFCTDARFLDATRRLKRGPDGTPAV